MFFKQIKHKGDNFSYIIADDVTKEAVVVDPSYNFEAIVSVIKAQHLNLKYIINTHQHYDHTGDNETLKATFGAKVIAHKVSNVEKDISVDDGDLIKLSGVNIKIIHTPGHSPDSISLYINGKVLTGDTLFIGECGRTDLQGGNAEQMYDSLFNKLMRLYDDIEVYPGHDYGVTPDSTIGEQKKKNYTLKKRSLKEFVEFMGQP